MTYEDDVAAVVEMALEHTTTEGRSKQQQRSLLRVAHEVDKARNANVGTNSRFVTKVAGIKEYRGGGHTSSRLEGSPSDLAIRAGCQNTDCRICRATQALKARQRPEKIALDTADKV